MIRVTELVYKVGTFTLELSLEVATGEYFVLMGPTGSGKTAAVECLAGLRAPAAGRIEISGRDVTAAEPRRRGVGYVPQDGALFSHRTVRRNIAFGPEVRGCPRADIAQAVQEAARRVGIESLLDRRIEGLSGGERQRVALARALAVRPAVLILDEPVSALDDATRNDICEEIRRLQRELRLTTIHISHNVEEAFSVADRAGIIQAGRIRQVGTMAELLRQPRDRSVARFMRCENILSGLASGPSSLPGTTRVSVAGHAVDVPGAGPGMVTFIVRPENLVIGRPEQGLSGTGTPLAARLIRAVDRGPYVRLELDSAVRLVAHMPPEAFRRLSSGPGSDLSIVIRPEATHVLEE